MRDGVITGADPCREILTPRLVEAGLLKEFKLHPIVRLPQGGIEALLVEVQA